MKRVRLQLLQIDWYQVKKTAPMLSSSTGWREIAQDLKQKAAKNRIIANTPTWMEGVA